MEGFIDSIIAVLHGNYGVLDDNMFLIFLIAGIILIVLLVIFLIALSRSRSKK